MPEPMSGTIQIHPSGWIIAQDSNFHGKVLQSEGYPLEKCTPCHGKSYQGGTSRVTCMRSGCHATSTGVEKSPEACNTCHGLFRSAADDTLSWAPPHSLNGDTIATSSGVGAHQAHLTGDHYSNNARCNQCHEVPSDVFQTGHLDSPPADIVFNTSLAVLITADGTFQPNPSYSTLRCSGTYCHGSWKLRRESSLNSWAFSDSAMTGEAYNPLWTGGDDEAECGSCHALPPLGHQPYQITDCTTCHTGVVDGSGVITDKFKHINGKVNVLGTERSF
jgi:predicted CxxxxCH...CXXCH cytochrome family protein